MPANVPPSTLVTVALLLLLGAGETTGAAGPRDPGAGECEQGKGIERDLGQRGYRVVVGGGYRMQDERVVKVQIWENEDRDWVITERFLERKRTCVVRSGRALHMLY